jgi:hypothetical protein
MVGKGRIKGSKNVTKTRAMPAVQKASVSCEFCGVSAPGNSQGKPMQHFDGRVENAHRTNTYCDGKRH